MPGKVIGSSLSFIGEAWIGATDVEGGAVNERLVQDMILVRDTGMLATDFVDNFNDNLRDEGRWKVDAVLPGGGVPQTAHTVAEVNQQVRITLDTVANGYNGYSSLFLYDFTGSYARVEVVEAPALAPAETYLIVGPSTGLSAMMRPIGGVLFCRRTNPTVTVTLAYDPVLHHHFRIRHEPSDDTFRFETSPNGLDWTERASHARTFAITAVRIELLAGKNGTVDPGTQAVFDNFNTTASQVYTYPIQDSLLMPDTAAPQAEHPREVLDQLLLSDQARQEAARVASILDRLLLSDQTRQQADRQALVQGTLLLSDAQRRTVEAARAIADALLLSDNTVVTAERLREILDALLVSDVFTAQKIVAGEGAQIITRLVQDTLLLADVYRREQEMVVRASAGLADRYLLDRHLILRDRVELLGEISKEALRLRAIVDLISTLDTTAATAIRMRLITDAVPLADAVQKVQEMIIRAPISLVDSVISTLFETIIRILTGIRIALVDPLGRNHDVRYRNPLGRATGDKTQTPFVRAVGWRNQP
jgi:hypothetical protein